MAKNNRNQSGSNRSRSRSDQALFDWRETARERPLATAAAVGAAAAAGAFLWSRRNQISDQISQLSDQIGEWAENMNSERELEIAGSETRFTSALGSGATGEFATTPADSTSSGTSSPSWPAGSKRPGGTGGVNSGTLGGDSLDTRPSGIGPE